MYCMKCGAQMPEAAHFCPGCGMAVAGTPVAGTPGAADAPVAAPPPRSRRAMPMLIAGVLVVIAVAVIAWVVMRRPPTTATASTPTSTSVPDSVGATNTASGTPATSAFDWSGLNHEDLLKARNSLDAAIAREEHASSAGTAAQANAR